MLRAELHAEQRDRHGDRGGLTALALGSAAGVARLAAIEREPGVGAVTGGLNFDNYFLPLSSNVTAVSLAEAQKQGAVLGYGAFITIVFAGSEK